jgi:hypothetical protein
MIQIFNFGIIKPEEILKILEEKLQAGIVKNKKGVPQKMPKFIPVTNREFQAYCHTPDIKLIFNSPKGKEILAGLKTGEIHLTYKGIPVFAGMEIETHANQRTKEAEVDL